ncbi:ATP synthase subunit gamma, mitochondrial [Fagus crenata]
MVARNERDKPEYNLRDSSASVDVKKNVIVTISSDKGLCGGINSTSVKNSKALQKLASGPDKKTNYVVVGEKAKVSVLADDILKNVEYDALRIVFNKFHSVVQFLPTTATVLSPEIVEREAESGGKLGALDSYEIEGGEKKAEVLQNLAEYQFSCVLFNAVLENACSEQGARMSAMDSSSRNAGNMLDRLTLTYNSSLSLSLSHTHTHTHNINCFILGIKTRQASITTELIEIISGASALQG